jgi:GMP synthase-like glutamine amidotransferase
MSIRRILVIQVRESRSDRERERLAFMTAAKRFHASLHFLDAFSERPDLSRREPFQGVMIAGSALSVFEPGVPHAKELTAVVEDCVHHHWPLLGICFGAQFIAHALGGQVVRDKINEELGTHEIKLRPDAEHDRLLRDLPDRFMAQQAHQDRIEVLPESAVLLASSDYCNVQAFRMHGTPVYGIQFHPECTHTDMAERLSRNMLDRPEDSRLIERARRSLRPTPEAETIIHTFIERVIFGIT